MYSQNDEEKIILHYFRGTVGRLLEFGANDGKTFSNSLALIERGWEAMLVEPDSRAVGSLQLLHSKNKNVLIFPGALGSRTARVTFHESGSLLGNGDIGLVSTFKDSEMRRWDSLNMEYSEREVLMGTLADYLKLAKRRKWLHFDLVLLDIEGMELEVLPQFDFHKLQTKMVVVEWNSKDLAEYDKILKPFGFTLIHKNQENLIYAIK